MSFSTRCRDVTSLTHVELSITASWDSARSWRWTPHIRFIFELFTALGTSSYPEAGDCRVTELTRQTTKATFNTLSFMPVFPPLSSISISVEATLGPASYPSQNLHLHLQQLPAKSALVCPEAKEWESEISSDWITAAVI